MSSRDGSKRKKNIHINYSVPQKLGSTHLPKITLDPAISEPTVRNTYNTPRLVDRPASVRPSMVSQPPRSPRSPRSLRPSSSGRRSTSRKRRVKSPVVKPPSPPMSVSILSPNLREIGGDVGSSEIFQMALNEMRAESDTKVPPLQRRSSLTERVINSERLLDRRDPRLKMSATQVMTMERNEQIKLEKMRVYNYYVNMDLEALMKQLNDTVIPEEKMTYLDGIMYKLALSKVKPSEEEMERLLRAVYICMLDPLRDLSVLSIETLNKLCKLRLVKDTSMIIYRLFRLLHCYSIREYGYAKEALRSAVRYGEKEAVMAAVMEAYNSKDDHKRYPASEFILYLVEKRKMKIGKKLIEKMSLDRQSTRIRDIGYKLSLLSQRF